MIIIIIKAANTTSFISHRIVSCCFLQRGEASARLMASLVLRPC